MTTTRTADDIHAEIRALDLPDPKLPATEFWSAQAEYCDRLAALWGEIAKLSAGDPSVPVWAQSAAWLTKCSYGEQAHAARREAYAAQQEESTR